MKKKVLLSAILALTIGATAFARGGNYRGYHNGNMGRAPMIHGHSGHGRALMANNPEFEKVAIAMDEKRLEIRKEMIKDAPDWSKIEKLNVEMATERAKFKTQMMKTRHEEMIKHQELIQKREAERKVSESATPTNTAPTTDNQTSIPTKTN